MSEMPTPRDDLSPDEIARIAASLRPYDPSDLLAGVGGVQLLPENADHFYRLEAIASLIGQLAVTPVDEQPIMGAKRWRDLLNKAPVSTSFLRRMEDPQESLFVEQVTFFGGSWLILPGLAEEVAFITRMLLRALFQAHAPFPDQEFVRYASRLAGLVLRLSDETLRSAGLRRGAPAIHSRLGDVSIPPTQRFDQVKRAVSYEPDSIARIIGSSGASEARLADLAMPRGNALSEAVQRVPLLKTPLVRVGPSVIVAGPAALLGALRHQIVSSALRRSASAELVLRYRSAVLDAARQSLDLLEARPVRLPMPPAGDAPFVSEWFSFDRNKLVHAVIVTDQLMDYDLADPYTLWPTGSIANQLQSHLAGAADVANGVSPKPDEVMYLVVMQGIGRQLRLGIPGDITPKDVDVLFLTGADLEVISLLERGNPLALRQYVQAKRRFHDLVQVRRFSELDEYAFYRSHDHSFYASDERLPTLVLFQNGLAEQLRKEVWQRYDFHGVLGPSGHGAIEVVLLHDDAAIPVYTRRQIGTDVNVLIEGLPFDIWVLGPEGLRDRQYVQVYFDVTDLVAYWLWQFTPDLQSLLASVPSALARLRIQLQLPPDPRWFADTNTNGRSGAQPADAPDPALSVRSSIRNEEEIDLELDARIMDELDRADNRGERTIMRNVLHTLARWVGQNGGRVPPDFPTWAESLLDRHAPLGRKKKLVVVSGDQAWRLRTDQLPLHRLVQPAEEARILGEIGAFLADGLHLAEGQIPENERTSVLNEIVGHLFRQLEDELTVLDHAEVLPALVAYNERLIAEYRLALLQLPTRLACYAETHDVIKSLREQIPEDAKASAASRFLIEFATAITPSGTRPVTLASYDRLMALASEIASFGWSSDLNHFELADIKLHRLQSGRLGQSQGLFDRGREEFLNSFALGTVFRSASNFGRNWEARSTGDVARSELIEEIDRAAEVELGVTITELMEFLVEGINAGSRRPQGAKIAPRGELLAELAAGLSWEASKVDRAFELLSLRPRSALLTLAPPFRAVDVYPWRFNRALSYLRRPFLIRRLGNTDEVIWGIRNLFEAFDYLGTLVLSGRLKAETARLRRAIGSVQARDAEAFNDQVADACAQLPGIVVRRRVKKIGRLRIAGSKGEDLGDIDVLAADTRLRILWSIETKDLEAARTPAELSNELASTFASGGLKPSYAEKHAARPRWLFDHLADVLTELALDVGELGKWRVEPLIVVSHELMSPFITEATIATVPSRELLSVLAGGTRTVRRSNAHPNGKTRRRHDMRGVRR